MFSAESSGRSMAKMSNTELLGIVDGYLTDAIDFDNSDRLQDRVRAIDFREGKVDFEAEPNKSSVVSHDVADTINAIKPGVMRVFAASDRVVVYEGRQEKDVEGAKQATDCINYYWWNEWNGYRVLYDAIDDGLGLRNGIIKHIWDPSKVYKTETLTGLSEEDLLALQTDETVEDFIEVESYMVGADGKVVDGEESGEMSPDKEAGEPDVDVGY
jgi:hypothetical protein